MAKNENGRRLEDAYDALTLETCKIRALAKVIDESPDDSDVAVFSAMIGDLVDVVNYRATAILEAAGVMDYGEPAPTSARKAGVQ